MPLPIPARDYLLKALDGTPVVFFALLETKSDDDPIWDKRPDPERFTLREVLAHLADWEPIWLERLQKIATGQKPLLPSIDEGQLAVDRRYQDIPPSQSLRLLREGRNANLAYLKTIAGDTWDFTGEREFVGELTLQQLAFFMLAHDTYHLRQAAEWIA